ncbi:hypothetical protein DPMN_084097 [Dreissena polymorpha]|uniref:Uncharacterized protein n=1 Tax=Dreissena polymorpha TaxID=45954 RepID=A0A9D4BBQ9_DREPO|nr:hypothetical protein DPMN_084097 [Dreissena polymorpha]
MSIRSPHDCFTINSIFLSTNTRPLPERFSIHFLLDRYSIFLICQKLSGRKPDQCRPTLPPPTTHADRTRPVPDRLIGLDRVDLIGSGNPGISTTRTADELALTIPRFFSENS